MEKPSLPKPEHLNGENQDKIFGQPTVKRPNRMNTPTRPNTVFHIQRIYDFHTAPPHSAAIFADRLHPRGIAKIRMKNLIWIKDLTPSIALRRWYHESLENRFSEFAARYREELAKAPAQAALRTPLTLSETHSDIILLTAVRNPARAFLFCWII